MNVNANGMPNDRIYLGVREREGEREMRKRLDSVTPPTPMGEQFCSKAAHFLSLSFPLQSVVGRSVDLEKN